MRRSKGGIIVIKTTRSMVAAKSKQRRALALKAA